jgi:hypothetical protein
MGCNQSINNSSTFQLKDNLKTEEYFKATVSHSVEEVEEVFTSNDKEQSHQVGDEITKKRRASPTLFLDPNVIEVDVVPPTVEEDPCFSVTPTKSNVTQDPKVFESPFTADPRFDGRSFLQSPAPKKGKGAYFSSLISNITGSLSPKKKSTRFSKRDFGNELESVKGQILVE